MSPGRARLNQDANASRFFREIHQIPMLDAETEQDLCRRWRDHHDIAAAHRLVRSHLRLVAKIARGYRGYGMPSDDLISEGHVGLMRAVCRFDPDRSVRFATYAIWWIRAAMQEFILRNWSMVRMATTASQKKLFFNLRRVHGQLQLFDENALAPEHVAVIASKLSVPQQDVVSMTQRLAGPDHSLNAAVGADRQTEWQSLLVDECDDQETIFAAREEAEHRSSLLPLALAELNLRERHIIAERHLKETPRTLEDLSRHHGVSRERVRQIEMRALSKLQRSVRSLAAY